MKDPKELLNKIDEIDENYVNHIGDEIFQHQPFVLSVLLSYRLNTKVEELDDLMKVYFVMWEYFKHKERVKQVQITEGQFQEQQLRNIHFFKYLEGETDEVEKKKIISGNLEQLDAKDLLTAIFFWFKSRPALANMNKETQASTLISLKTFVECFELIIKGNEIHSPS